MHLKLIQRFDMNGENMNDVRISVIIPCYNCEKTVVETLDSLEFSAGLLHEVICINDGSIDGYNYLRPLLTYFAFEGTGSKDSDNPAELVLEFEEPLNQLTWKYYSKENYTHNNWIYLGLGGYYAKWNEGIMGINRGWKEITDAYELVAADFSELISDEIDKMATEQNGKIVPYYPVGIVLLNNGVDNASTLKKILLLNNKYRLQYDPNKPADYIPATTSAAASYSSGMHDQNVAAFGWD